MTTSGSTPTGLPVAPEGPVVAIVGRPNVGKSTLFNRLTGTRRAITDDRPGVTRDRIRGTAEWGGHRFTLVDTGGYVPRAGGLEGQVRQQAEKALEESDLVLLVCDATEGVSAADRDVADLLRRRDVRCLLVVNKVDHPDPCRYDMGEFFGLGLGDPHPVSGATGRRSGDLLQAIVSGFDDPASPEPDRPPEEVRVVLAGRPNVGKSTLINRLCGERISIVHAEPGTTRDSTDVTILRGGRRFVLVDTAGIRRRARVQDPVEYFSTLRASHSLERSDVVVVLLDAVEGTTAQDARLMSRVMELGRGMVVAVNKWDLVAGSARADIDAYRDGMRRRHPFLQHYPILTLSAMTGRRAAACLDTSAAVAGRRPRPGSHPQAEPVARGGHPEAGPGRRWGGTDPLRRPGPGLSRLLSSCSAITRTGSARPIAASWRTTCERASIWLGRRSASTGETGARTGLRSERGRGRDE